MATKKVFTSLEFGSGALLKKSKIELVSDANDLTGNDPTFSASAGQLAYAGDTNLYLGVGSTWAKLMRVGQPISTASVLTSTLASNSGNAPPFVVASTDKVVNLNADLLDGKDSSATAVADKIPIYGTDGVLPVGTPAANGDAATKLYVDTEIAGLVDSAPEHINTLGELAAALGTGDGAATVVTQLAAKVAKAGDTMTGDLLFGDSVKAKFGDSSSPDLEIYHDGSNSYIKENGTGDLYLGAGNGDVYIQGESGQNGIVVFNDEDVRLYHNGSWKLGTTSGGINVTGTATTEGLTVNGNSVTTGTHKVSGDLILNSNADAKIVGDSDSIDFINWNAAGTGYETQMTLLDTAKVGIGADATSPSGTLHVSTARYGDNLITGDNADFSVSDETGVNGTKYNWSPYGANTVAISNEQLVITNIDHSSAGYSYLPSTTVGRKYKAQIDVKYTGGSSAAVLQFWNGTSTISVATLTTSLVTYTVEFERVTSAPYWNFNTPTSGQSVTIDNLKLQEDNLANGVHAYGDDLVVNGNGNTGISIIGQAGATSNLYFGDGIQKDFARITSTRAVDGGDANLFLQVSDGGAAAATAMTLYGGNQSAKFEGNVGIRKASNTVVGLSVGAPASNNTNYGLEVCNASSNTRFLVDGVGNVSFYKDTDNSVSGRFTSDGKLVIGGDTAAGTLHVKSGSAGTITAEAYADDLIIENSDHVGIALRCPDAKDGFLLFQSATNDRVAEISAEYNGGDENLAFVVNDNKKFSINTSGTQDHQANPIVNSATVQGLQDGGACYDFDGESTTDITLSTGNALGFGSKDFSFACWAKAENTTAGDRKLIWVQQQNADGSSGGADACWQVRRNSTGNHLYFQMKAGGSWSTVSTTSSSVICNDTEWHHYVVTKSGTTGKVYLDGVEQEVTGSAAATLDDTTGTAKLGTRHTNSGEAWVGQMRDVKIFTSALTAGDVRKLYSGENPKKNLNVDILQNGDFSSATGWTEGNWEITGGKAVGTAGDSYLVQSSVLSTSKKYLYTIVIDAISNGSVYIYSGQGASNTTSHSYYAGFDTVGTHTAVLDTDNTNLGLYIAGSTTVTISSIKAVEIDTLVDFTSQSASSSKWYNEALLGYYDGTVNNATLSQGNSYWNNIKQDGADVSVTSSETQKPVFSLINTNADAEGGQLVFQKTTTDEADNDILGRVFFKGQNSASQDTEYAEIYGQSVDVTDGTEDGVLRFRTMAAGTLGSRLTLSSENTKVHGKLGVGGDASSSDEQLLINGTGGDSAPLLKLIGSGSHGFNWISSAVHANLTADEVSAHFFGVSQNNKNCGYIGFKYKGDSSTDNLVTLGFHSANHLFNVAASGSCGIGTESPETGSLLTLKKGDDTGICIHTNTDTVGKYSAIKFKTVSTSNTSQYQKGSIFYENTGGSDTVNNGLGVGSLVFAIRNDGTTANAAPSDAVLVLNPEGHHDHKANRIVNSQTVSDLHRTAEPSIRFDGSDDLVSITQTLPSDIYTVTGWIKFETDAAVSYWFDNRDSDTTNSNAMAVYTEASSNKRRIIVFHQSAVRITTGYIIPENVWTHLALTKDGGDIKLYIDGVYIDANDGGATNATNGSNLRIGRRCTNENHFQGEMRAFGIYNRDLDADEVKGIYNGESTPFKYVNAGEEKITGVGVNFATACANVTAFNTAYNGSSAGNMYSSGPTAPGISVANNACVITNTSTDSGNGSGLRFNIGAVAGQTYRLKLNVTAITGNWYVRASNSGWVTLATINSTGAKEIELPAWAYSDTSLYLVGGAQNDTITITAGTINNSLAVIGEVASYTPRSINAYDGKWYDETSNANHGAITGATTVGNPRHYGTFHVKGKTTAGIVLENTTASSDIDINYANEAGDIQSRIRYDEANGKFQFYSNTGQSPRMEIEYGGAAGGAVKATSGSSTNLKQVARTTTDTIEGDGTAVAFEVNHQLGTKFLTVSVREKDNGAGQSYAYVDTEIRGGAWADANGALESVQTNTEESHITVIFSTAPANGKDYYVTCVGA